MIYQVVNLPRAENDLASLRQNLQELSPGTIPKVEQEFRNLYSQLTDFPFSYQATNDPTTRGAFLRSCRYAIYFQVKAQVPKWLGATAIKWSGELSGGKVVLAHEKTQRHPTIAFARADEPPFAIR